MCEISSVNLSYDCPETIGFKVIGGNDEYMQVNQFLSFLVIFRSLISVCAYNS